MVGSDLSAKHIVHPAAPEDSNHLAYIIFFWQVSCTAIGLAYNGSSALQLAIAFDCSGIAAIENRLQALWHCCLHCFACLLAFSLALQCFDHLLLWLHWLHWQQGVGTLLPWNAFITAAGYYGTRFCGTAYESNFESFFGFSFMFAQLTLLSLAVKYGSMFPVRWRIVVPLLGYSTIFVITTALVGVDMDGESLFWITLLMIFCAGACGAVLSGGVFGLAGMFPPIYTQAIMGGQGLAGLMIAVASVITTAASSEKNECNDDDETDDGCGDYKVDPSALAYFIVATLVLLSCAASYFYLETLPITKYYTQQGSEDIMKHGLLNESESESESFSQADSAMEDTLNLSQNSNQAPNKPHGLSWSHLVRVLRKIKRQAFVVWCVFIITIGLFPAVTSQIVSVKECDGNNIFYNDLFVPFSFVNFNLFDFAGRSFAGVYQLIPPKHLWFYAVLRIVFFPLFFLCNVANSSLPTIFSSDAWPILFMILFAFTNGYVASLGMMYGPSMVHHHDMELAGTVMVLFLTLGLFSGSVTSFLSLFIATGSA